MIKLSAALRVLVFMISGTGLNASAGHPDQRHMSYKRFFPHPGNQTPVPDDNLNVGAQGVPEFEECHLPHLFPG